VSFFFFLSFATFRMRSSACDTLTRLCARLLRARPERQRDHRAANEPHRSLTSTSGFFLAFV
jgi:hypothetical protein